MGFDLEKLPDVSITILTLHEDYKIPAEMAVSTPKVIELINAQPDSVIHVVDARLVKLTFDEALAAANLLSRGVDPLYHNPKIREVVYVTTNVMIRGVLEGLRDQTFGNVSINVFETLDEALTYSRDKLKGE